MNRRNTFQRRKTKDKTPPSWGMHPSRTWVGSRVLRHWALLDEATDSFNFDATSAVLRSSEFGPLGFSLKHQVVVVAVVIVLASA